MDGELSLIESNASPEIMVHGCVNMISGTYVDFIEPNSNRSLEDVSEYFAYSSDTGWTYIGAPKILFSQQNDQMIGQILSNDVICKIYDLKNRDGRNLKYFRVNGGGFSLFPFPESAKHSPINYKIIGAPTTYNKKGSKPSWNSPVTLLRGDGTEEVYRFNALVHVKETIDCTNPITHGPTTLKREYDDPSKAFFSISRRMCPNGSVVNFDNKSTHDSLYCTSHHILPNGREVSSGQTSIVNANIQTQTLYSNGEKCFSKMKRSPFDYWIDGDKTKVYLTTESEFSDSPPITFQYTQSNKHLLPAISKKCFPEGRFLEINYGEYCRVKQLLVPDDTNGKSIAIYDFWHKPNRNTKKIPHPSTKGKFIEVPLFAGSSGYQDLRGVSETFEYNDSLLMETIHTHKDKQLLRTKKFLWGSDAQLGFLLGSQVINPSGEVIQESLYEYDDCGNPIVETIHGKICSSHSWDESITYKEYSKEGRNNLLLEKGPRNLVKYEYMPKTNLISKILICDLNNQVLKRTFYLYDNEHFLIETCIDDGDGQLFEDLTNVKKRLIIKQAPKANGICAEKPLIVEAGYLDLVSHEFKLLSKKVYAYDDQGNRVSENVFDQNGSLAYTSLYFYDKFHQIIKTINPLGHVTEFTYDANGNLITAIGPRPGEIKTLCYDKRNRPIKETKDGKTIFREYSHYDELVKEVDINGNIHIYGYDAFKNLISHSTSGLTEQIKYDVIGRLIETTDRNGYATTHEQNIFGKPLRIDYPDGTFEQSIYSIDGLLIEHLSRETLRTTYEYDPLGRLTTTQYWDVEGLLIKEERSIYQRDQLIESIDGNGISTFYAYDDAGRLIKETKGTISKSYGYDNLNRKNKTIVGDTVSIQVFDSLNRVVEERAEDLDGQIFTRKRFEYDSASNCIKNITYREGKECVAWTDFDLFNRPIKIVDELGAVTSITYCDSFKLENDTYGSQTIIVDPLGLKTMETRNGFNHLIQKQILSSQDELLSCQKFFYDFEGNLLEQETFVIEDNQHVDTQYTQFEYNEVGKLTLMREAATSPINRTTYTFYNEFGQKNLIVKPDGSEIHYDYDPFGRIAHKWSKGAVQEVDYSYGYDAEGNLLYGINCLKEHSEIRFTYNANNSVETESLASNLFNSYEYDQCGRPSRIYYDDGREVTYRYRGILLSDVSLSHQNQIATHRYLRYNESGELLESKLPGKAGTLVITRDQKGRPIDIQSTNWKQFDTSFDNAGNILSRTVRDHFGSKEYFYTYDDLYRLVSENNEVYSFDSVNNRTQKNGQRATFDELNQIQFTQESAWDLNGNLTKYNGWTMTYDALDRLVKATDSNIELSFFYDALDRRYLSSRSTYWSRLIGIETTSKFRHIGHDEVQVSSDFGSTVTRVLGNSKGGEIGAAIMLQIDGSFYAPTHDPFGNPVALQDVKDGKLYEGARYSAFGEEEEHITLAYFDSAVPWKYQGKYYETDLLFYNFGKRYYSPELARFVTCDPLSYDEGPNLYAFVKNNPLKYIDCYGLKAQNLWICTGCTKEHINELGSYGDKFLQFYTPGFHQLGCSTWNYFAKDTAFERTGSKTFSEMTHEEYSEFKLNLALDIVGMIPVNKVLGFLGKTAMKLGSIKGLKQAVKAFDEGITLPYGGAPTKIMDGETYVQSIQGQFVSHSTIVSRTENKIINPAKQGKHLYGNAYQEGKSILDHPYPQSLVNEFSGKGVPNIRGEGYRETVNFGEHIGYYVHKDSMVEIPTSVGTIHYSKTGTHIVPERHDFLLNAKGMK